VNAGSIGCEFESKLPEHMTPKHTEGREGFIHLTGMSGNCSEARLEFILRDHDRPKLSEKCGIMKDLAAYMNRLYGEGVVNVELTESYRNMYEILEKRPEIIEIALEAIREIGCEPEISPIRGGTDGSGLTFMGLPCPNLGTGGGNYHGPYEYCVLDDLEKSVEMLVKISEKVALLEK
ncbi:MAG: M20/M25/M40 family metallo-hydrolase, partial [Firmicutes bacterium]|nr:M20/M25/M40 family metallo-hydrolase [Bacillota bacterium]